MMKNAFYSILNYFILNYFILKAPVVLKICKFLSGLFGNVRKMA